MAQGRATSLGWLIAGLVVLTLMVSSGFWNPFPGLWDWINAGRPLSDPPTRWQERLGGVPKTVTVLGDHIVVEHRESVEVRSRATGGRLWQADADWAAVAGATVVTGKLLVKGYEVRAPDTGAVIRRDDRAAAVWTFADAMIDVSCRTSRDCELTARRPSSGEVIWQVGLPGIGFVLFADNPELAGARMMAPVWGSMPPLLGFPIDGQVHVVDTRRGRAFKPVEPERDTRIHVFAGRVLHTVATPKNGRCVPTVVARDGASGTDVWRRNGYTLMELSGAGCEQRGEPVAGGDAVMAVRPDGRQALLDAGDGREVLTAGDGETILGTNGVHAVVRSADGTRLSGYALGRAKPLWNREAAPDATVTVTGNAVVISDHSPDRVIVLEPGSGRVRAEVRSGAEVVGHGPAGLVLADRRELGYLAFGQQTP